MKKRLPLILVIVFVVFVLMRVYTGMSYTDLDPIYKQEYEVIVGPLRFMLKPHEEKSLKNSYVDMLNSYNEALKAQETVQDTEQEKDEEKDEEKDVTEIYPSFLIRNSKSYRESAEKLNKKLNKYTKQYLLDTKVAEKDEESKTQLDKSNLISMINEDIDFTPEKQSNQKKIMERLSKELSKEDYSALSKIVRKMNENSLYKDPNVSLEMAGILQKYESLSPYMIIDELRGEHKILAYYELKDGELVREELSMIEQEEVTPKQEKKYTHLLNSAIDILKPYANIKFQGFYIYTDGEKNTFSAAKDYQSFNRGYLGIDINDFITGIETDFDENRFKQVIVYQFAKVMIAGRDQIDYSKGASTDINGLWSIKEASKKDSFILSFYNRYWTDLLYTDAAVALSNDDKSASKYFYIRHRDKFQDEYSAGDPYKDATESMMRFFIEDENNSVLEKDVKTTFFYEFEGMDDIRKTIQNNIENMEV